MPNNMTARVDDLVDVARYQNRGTFDHIGDSWRHEAQVDMSLGNYTAEQIVREAAQVALINSMQQKPPTDLAESITEK